MRHAGHCKIEVFPWKKERLTLFSKGQNPLSCHADFFFSCADSWMYKSAELNQYRFVVKWGSQVYFVPSNQRHTGAMHAGLWICNKPGLCQHVHCCVSWFQFVSWTARRHILSKQMFFSRVRYFCVLRKASSFCLGHIEIINSSLIPLWWLHVRPYLPLNTLSPINIFQISDTICRIQMKQPQQLLALCCRRSGQKASFSFFKSVL